MHSVLKRSTGKDKMIDLKTPEKDHTKSTKMNNDTPVMNDENEYSLCDSMERSLLTHSKSSRSNNELSLSELVLAEKEAKEVKRVRLLVVLVVLMSVGGAIAVYYYSKSFENDQFEKQFYNDGNKVLVSLGSSLVRALSGLDSLAGTIVAISRSTNQSFPFVNIQDYSIHASKSMTVTKAFGTYLLPVVSFEQRKTWESYAARYPENNTTTKNEKSLLDNYVTKTIELQESWSHYFGPVQDLNSWKYDDVIHGDFGPIPYNKSRDGIPDILLPEWHKFPLVMTSYTPANWDWLSMVYPISLTNTISKRKATISQPLMIPRADNAQALAEAALWCPYYQDFIAPGENCMEPLSQWYYPILDSYDVIDVKENNTYNRMYPKDYEVEAVIVAEFYWHDLMKDILPENSKGMILVSENTCVPDVPFTYQIDGPNVTWIGVGDHHNPKYDQISLSNDLFNLTMYQQGESEYTGVPVDQDDCVYYFRIYPSDEMKQSYETNQAVIFAVTAAAFIIFPFLVFILYDMKTTKRQQVILSSANQSNAIVSSLFPKNIRDKMMSVDASGKRIDLESNTKDTPIAELYPETTVLFADIADFTVWASVRDPFQVFTLLETLYVSYDYVAERRKIFKVETVGDCYIAVCGLPTPRRQHAVTMAKFAKDILIETAIVTLKLEKRLGPGTSTLRVRVGLNSGPTTAGVLRGAKGRFQLFGDTVNTASQMESNSLPGQILASEKTANCLITAGKDHWITRRGDLVQAKGKGLMQCYWINPKSENKSSAEFTERLDDLQDENPVLIKDHRLLVDWMTGLFEEMLQEVVHSRAAVAGNLSYRRKSNPQPFDVKFLSPREEVTESIAIPCNFEAPDVHSKSAKVVPAANNLLSPTVKSQIQEYIGVISRLYAENPFNNFEHACHVVLVAKKLLARVVKPDETAASKTAYGITSDPITQFAIIFSALIHDVDHHGVSNAQLVKEKSRIAILYKDKSVAEQNSITIAWDLLMQPRFSNFCDVIMSNDAECRLFRQLLVNAVLATDLFDKDLKMLRDKRWDKAFLVKPSSSSPPSSPIRSTISDHDSNRRATIVIEHIIQAADVSHTMQHWHVYQKWNKKLLREMYIAYINGRAEKDPTNGWYEGEIWFFDNYIIPLARKLKTCGVFGVSCDELLDYALENRAEWAAKGKAIIAESIIELKDMNSKHHDDHKSSNMKFVSNALNSVVDSIHSNMVSPTSKVKPKIKDKSVSIVE